MSGRGAIAVSHVAALIWEWAPTLLPSRPLERKQERQATVSTIYLHPPDAIILEGSLCLSHVTCHPERKMQERLNSGSAILKCEHLITQHSITRWEWEQGDRMRE